MSKFKAIPFILTLTALACSSGHSELDVGTVHDALTVLVGDTTKYTTTDSAAAGQPRAWRFTAGAAGQADTLNLCLANSNAATSVQVGLYASNAGGTAPSTLLASGTISPVVKGWNSVGVSSTQIAQGQNYWLAVLSPKGGKTVTVCGWFAGTVSQAYGARMTAGKTFTTLQSTYPSADYYAAWTAGFYASASGQSGAGGATGSGGAATGGDPGTGGAQGSGGSPGSGGAATGGSVGDGGAASGGDQGAGGAGGSGTPSYIRQYAEAHISNAVVFDMTVTLPQPVLSGSTIVAFTFEQYIPSEGHARPVTVTDTASGTYTLLDTVADADDRALATTKDFVRFGAPAGSLSATAHFQYDTDWQALVVAEVVGTSSLLAHAAQLQAIPNTNVDSASSGPLTFGSAPALVVGFSASGRAVFGAPLHGTGFSTFTTAINWGGAEGTANAPSATLESKRVLSSGVTAATFTPAGGSPPSEERLQTFGLVLAE